MVTRLLGEVIGYHSGESIWKEVDHLPRCLEFRPPPPLAGHSRVKSSSSRGQIARRVRRRKRRRNSGSD